MPSCFKCGEGPIPLNISSWRLKGQSSWNNPFCLTCGVFRAPALTMTSLSARTVYTLPSRLGKTMCGEPANQTTLPELHPSRLLAHWVDQNSHGLDISCYTNIFQKSPELRGQCPSLVGPLLVVEMPRKLNYNFISSIIFLNQRH